MFVAIAVRYGATTRTDELLFFYAPLAVIMTVASGAIEAGVTPHIQRAITDNTIARYIRRILLIGPSLAAVASVILATVFISLGLIDASVALTLCLAPIFATYSAIMSAFLTIERRFSVVFASPLPSGLIAIALVVWLPQNQMNLATSLVVFEAVRSTVLLLSARKNLKRYGESASKFNPALLKGTYRAVTLQIVGSGLTALNPVIDMAFAQRFLDAGAVSQIDYATRLWTAIPFLFAPWITRLHAEFCFSAKDGWIDARLVHRRAVAILPWVICITLAVMVTSQSIGGSLFRFGEITATDATIITDLLLFYAPAAAALVIAQVYLRALSAVVYLAPVTAIAMLGVIVNTAINYLLITRIGINGVAIATSITYALATSLLFVSFQRRMRAMSG